MVIDAFESFLTFTINFNNKQRSQIFDDVSREEMTISSAKSNPEVRSEFLLFSKIEYSWIFQVPLNLILNPLNCEPRSLISKDFLLHLNQKFRLTFFWPKMKSTQRKRSSSFTTRQTKNTADGKPWIWTSFKLQGSKTPIKCLFLFWGLFETSSCFCRHLTHCQGCWKLAFSHSSSLPLPAFILKLTFCFERDAQHSQALNQTR